MEYLGICPFTVHSFNNSTINHPKSVDNAIQIFPISPVFRMLKYFEFPGMECTRWWCCWRWSSCCRSFHSWSGFLGWSKIKGENFPINPFLQHPSDWLSRFVAQNLNMKLNMISRHNRIIMVLYCEIILRETPTPSTHSWPAIPEIPNGTSKVGDL